MGGGEGGREAWRLRHREGVDRIDERSENGRGESRGQGNRVNMSREKEEAMKCGEEGDRQEDRQEKTRGEQS